MIPGELAPDCCFVAEDLALDWILVHVNKQPRKEAAIAGRREFTPKIAAAMLAKGPFRPTLERYTLTLSSPAIEKLSPLSAE